MLHVGSIRQKQRNLAVVLLLLLALLSSLIPVAPVEAATTSPGRELVGDFNGDGKSDLASYDSATGKWMVAISNGAKFTNAVWTTFSTKTGWASHIVGDFNGDGKDDIANYHATSGNWWVSKSTGTAFTNKIWTTFSTKTGWTTQLVGDYDGNGKDDIANYHATSGNWWVSKSTGTAFTNAVWTTFSTKSGWGPTLIGDYNGDGKTDIANYHATSGNWWVSKSTGTAFTNAVWTTFSTKTGWGPTLIGDYNGDGKDDIANYHSASGNWWVSQSTGTKFTNKIWTTFSTKTGWTTQLVGDYDGNGRDDIASYDPGTGIWVVAKSTGSVFTNKTWTTFSTKTGWGQTLIGDYNGDGKDDIANYHSASGNWWVSKSTGIAFTNSMWLQVPLPPSTTTTTTTEPDTVIEVPQEMPTIQSAIDAAADGWTVLVNPDIYHERIDFKGKAITVRSRTGSNGTYLNGGGAGPVVKFHNGEPGSAVLEGFTIWGGAHRSFWVGSTCTTGVGGGISIDAASPTIRDVVLATNTADYGSGIGIVNGSPTLSGIVLKSNSLYVRHGLPSCTLNAQPVPKTVVRIDDLVSAGGLGDALVTVNGLDVAVIGQNWKISSVSTRLVDVSGWYGSATNASIQVDNLILHSSSGPGIRSKHNGNISLRHATIHSSAPALETWELGSIDLTDSVIVSSGLLAVCLETPQFERVIFSSTHDAPFEGECLDQAVDYLLADPMFVDAQQADFRLTANSPAIDLGTIADPVHVDIGGRSRFDGNGDGLVESDLGAWEWRP